MTDVVVKIMPLVEEFRMPLQATAEAAGFDCYYQGTEEIEVLPGARVLVPLGFAMEIPQGYEAQLRPRSGLAWKNGITVLNAPGTIDSDYRGEVKAMLVNLHIKDKEGWLNTKHTIKPGERVCQIVVMPIPTVALEQVEKLSDTDRGEGGFGSTGK